MLGNIQLVLKVDNQEVNIDISQYLNASAVRKQENDAIRDITLYELIKLYSQVKNIKQSTLDMYKSILRYYFKNLSLKLSEVIKIKLNLISSDTRTRIITAIFNFAVKNKIILNNPFTSQIEYRNSVVTHRNALNASDWRTIDIAKKNLTDFFAIVNSDNFNSGDTKIYRRIKDFNFKYLILLHMILGTRICETIEVIMNFNYENEIAKSITIRTKNTKKGAEPDFCVPLTKLAIYLIKQLQDLKKLKKRTIYTYVNNFFIKTFGNSVTTHGLRAIFRTTLDLLPETKAYDFNIKEACLDHRLLNKTQRAYQRYDYFSERYLIQKKYSKFLMSFFNIDNEFQAILDSDEYLDYLTK